MAEADDILQWLQGIPAEHLNSVLFGDNNDNVENTSSIGKEDLESVNDFIKSQRKLSTVRATERDVNKVRRFIQHRYNDHREIAEIPANALNEYLATFFINVKKDDGTDYEPDSISAVKHSIERHLSEQRYGVSLNDKQFDLANEGQANATEKMWNGRKAPCI